MFFKKVFKFELDDKNPGSTNINTNIIAIAGIICSKFIIINLEIDIDLFYVLKKNSMIYLLMFFKFHKYF